MKHNRNITITEKAYAELLQYKSAFENIKTIIDGQALCVFGQGEYQKGYTPEKLPSLSEIHRRICLKGKK